MRATVVAIDEATVYWLNAGLPYDVETMAHALADMATRTLSSIATLDPSTAVTTAVARIARSDEGDR